MTATIGIMTISEVILLRQLLGHYKMLGVNYELWLIIVGDVIVGRLLESYEKLGTINGWNLMNNVRSPPPFIS